MAKTLHHKCTKIHVDFHGHSQVLLRVRIGASLATVPMPANAPSAASVCNASHNATEMATTAADMCKQNRKPGSRAAPMEPRFASACPFAACCHGLMRATMWLGLRTVKSSCVYICKCARSDSLYAHFKGEAELAAACRMRGNAWQLRRIGHPPDGWEAPMTAAMKAGGSWCSVIRWGLLPRAALVTWLCVFVCCMLSLWTRPQLCCAPFLAGPSPAKPCTQLPRAVASARCFPAALARSWGAENSSILVRRTKFLNPHYRLYAHAGGSVAEAFTAHLRRRRSAPSGVGPRMAILRD